MNRTCKRCGSFKARQGTGAKGECRFNPPVIMLGSTYGEFPIVTEGTWCSKWSLNTEKYNEDGRKIYTKKGKRVIQSKTQLDAYHDGKKDWHKTGDSTGDWYGR